MVRCADCGFLEFRDRETGEAHTATEVIRQSAVYERDGQKYKAKFLCRADSPTFHTFDGTPQPQQSLQAINEEIDCEYFMPWQPAKTAKEHEQMSIVEKVERLNAQARREDIQRQEMWNRRNFRWLVMASGAAVISAISAAITIWLSL